MLTFMLLALTIFGDGPKPVHYNFLQKLSGLDGKPIKLTTENNAPDATLGDASVFALESMTDEDRSVNGIDKFKRDQLARKIYNKPDVVLTVEEIQLIKERVGKVFSPAVIGAAWPLLDPAVTGDPK